MSSLQKPIWLNQTERTPGVSIDFDTGAWRFWGESYPEDCAAFFGPILGPIQEHLTKAKDAITLDIELYYFNSSSAKVLMTLFHMVECSAKNGLDVTVNWCFEPNDDTMQEFGEDFAKDFSHASFNLCPKS